MGIFIEDKDVGCDDLKYRFQMPSIKGKGKAPRGTPFLSIIYALPFG